MKRFARSGCIILVLIMVLAIPVFATENVETRASSFFGGSSVYLCNVSGTTFEAWFDVTGTGGMDEIGANFIKIQRSIDGENWTTIKTFYKEDYPNLVNTNTVVHAAGVSHTGTRGYYYRAYIQLYAKNSSGSGVRNRYTSAIQIPLYAS